MLNIAISYLTGRNGPAMGWKDSDIGSDQDAFVIDPRPAPADALGADVIAGPTLESLFGEMDYCACEHCRSILSPAAYLVDLLLFCDRQTNEKENPQTVLFQRRPDIQHLPLTCENTNRPIPYIDLVNETLEYFVFNQLSLKDYAGHSTNGEATPEELLASPQFGYTEASGAAYQILADAVFPPPLPFHQPLENLRRYFDRFEAPLPEVMEELRKDDNLERANENEYGWRDILMEELLLSRAEYKLLTTYDPPLNPKLTPQQLYGFDPATPDADVLSELSNVKKYTRRVGITYDEIIEILKTRFVNPNSTLIPKLERLGVPFATLKMLKDTPPGDPFDAEFDEALAPHLDAAQYGGDIKAWVRDDANYANIMSLITLVDPDNPDKFCSFDKVTFRYADPAEINGPIREFEFIRLIRFIRLWKKLGWTIEQTDKAITALYPAGQAPDHPHDDAVNLQRLDDGFLTLLPRLGVIKRVMDALELKPNKDLRPLLACFAPIDTHGAASLYRQMFLSPALLKQDGAFADDGYGNFLAQNPPEKLVRHVEALRSALNLTADEYEQIVVALFPDGNDPLIADVNAELTLDNISAIFRRGWLARKLKLSVREFLLLTQFTGIDPFAAPDPPNPHVWRLIELVRRLRAVSLKPAQALYLIWNQDISGKSVPDAREITGFAHTLRSELTAIEDEFALKEDPDGSISRARMALVYGNEATDLFFGLLGNTLVTDVRYSHPQATLEQPILDEAPGRIAYDDFRKRLSYTGVLTKGTRDVLRAVAGVTADFRAAVDKLYEENQKIIKPFFDRYEELQPLYEAYAASNDLVEKKQSDLLANFLPELKRRRKRQQARQAISAAAGAEVAFASALLDDATVLHAADDNVRPALDDLTALEMPGLSAQFFFRDTATGNVDVTSEAEADLAYSATGINKLPSNGDNPADAISGIWSGYLEAPENGFFNLGIEADAGATVTLVLENAEGSYARRIVFKPAGGTETWTLDGQRVAETQDGNTWSNDAPIELRAGTLYAISLKAEKVKDTFTVRWQTTGRGWEVIPARHLYSETLTGHLRDVYVRFLKAVSLATNLKLTAAETAYLPSHRDYYIGGEGWLNRLPVMETPDNATSLELFRALNALLDFARIKAELAAEDERLLSVLKDPAVPIQKPGSGPITEPQRPYSLLFSITRWESTSLDALLLRFGKIQNGQPDRSALKDLATFRRIHDAYAWVKKLGIPASALIKAATNEPDAATVRDFQGALRARYDESGWLKVLKPINDQIRGLQRDALVTYILHQMRANSATEHINTPERLFEYFLMDVQMDPCMETSRIRHALSSVQLFIERCLMNLEPRVASSSIKAKQWQWMKRYRLWEANRKVFLYPENWLEPELRDDQSAFFKETMSELLQGDITEERAATALLDYLSKLEEVAKLEPCGIHYVENDPGTADDIAHVVARTAGANRKYFYRRREGGSWTPWEEIKLDIEDNPVLPVVWKGRLFLFWLRILKQAPLDTPELPSENLANVPASSLINPKAAKVTIQAILCWSEYYNGKWQPTKTSDVDRPTELGQFDAVGPSPFNRAKLALEVFDESNALHVAILGRVNSLFLLYSTHSLPVRREDPGYRAPAPFAPARTMEAPSGFFIINYSKWSPNGASPYSLTNPVLAYEIRQRVVAPGEFSLNSRWEAPFFYEDSRHLFYVTTAVKIPRLPQVNDYGVSVFPNAGHQIPPLVIKEDPRVWATEDAFASVITGRDPGVVDPAPIDRFVSEDAYINKGIGTTGTVDFDGAEIGPGGRRNSSHRR